MRALIMYIVLESTLLSRWWKMTQTTQHSTSQTNIEHKTIQNKQVYRKIKNIITTGEMETPQPEGCLKSGIQLLTVQVPYMETCL